MTFDFSALVIIGSTASGKTSLAHALSDELALLGQGTELVNLDAFQFYRDLTVGTAKPDPAEIERYRYHCVEFLEPDESFDAQAYAEKAWRACEDIAARGNLAICVGGSGLYLRAFLHGLDAMPARNDKVRAFLRGAAEEWGWPHLHGWLLRVDPVRGKELHPNDGVRIERALEVFLVTGQPQSEQHTRKSDLGEQPTCFRAFVVRADWPDAELRRRIEERTAVLLERGWIAEVRALRARFPGPELSTFQSMKAIGYLDILAELDANPRLSDGELAARLRPLIATRTWQYARRQRVWNAKETCDAQHSQGSSLAELVARVRAWRSA